MDELFIMYEMRDLPKDVQNLIISYKPLSVRDIEFVIPLQLRRVHDSLSDIFWGMDDYSDMIKPSAALVSHIQERVYVEFEAEMQHSRRYEDVDRNFFL